MTSRNYCWTLNNYTPEELAFLKNPDLLESFSYHVFGIEKGESGTPHLQGYTVFKKPLRQVACKKMFNTERIHLSMRKGTHEQASDYCKKDGDFFEFGNIMKVGKRSTAYSGIAVCKSYEEACALVEKESPRDWYIQGDKIRENLKRKFVPQFAEYVPIFEVGEFYPPPQLTEWLHSWDTTRTPCLFLIGPTKLGKTAWARSIVQPHCYWKSMVNLDEFNPDAKLLIFDDFDWKYMPNPKGWLTQAGQCTVTDKYRHKKTIIVNMPSIYISNELPEWTISENLYWRDNSKIINIVCKLF